MNSSHFTVAFIALSALFTVHCSSNVEPAPSEPTGQASEAICGNGIHPGCDPQCWPDDSSRTGGSRTCWTCSGDTYTQDCRVTCGLLDQACCNQPIKCFDGIECDSRGICDVIVFSAKKP